MDRKKFTRKDLDEIRAALTEGGATDARTESRDFGSILVIVSPKGSMKTFAYLWPDGPQRNAELARKALERFNGS